MKSFLSFFRKNPEKDILIGKWCTANDGGMRMLYGSNLIFNEDGIGIMESWGQGAEDFF